MQRIEQSAVNRRAVVGGLCASGLVVAYGASQWPAEVTGRLAAVVQGRPLAMGEMQRWTGLVGTRFQAAGFQLRLAGVRPLTSVGMRPASVRRRSAFLAVFDVVAGGDMPGDLIYAMSAPGHILDVFITSGASPEFPNRMHAVFN